MNSPLVSVIIPTFNRSKTIIHTLESVINQTYNNIEIYIVDDGSTDYTKEGVMGYISAYVGEKTIYYIYQDNAGAPAARNNGFCHSSGEYIIFFDSDDEMYPNRVQLQIESMQNDNSDACSAGYDSYINGRKVNESRNYIWKNLSPLDNWLMFYVKGKGLLGGTQAWMYRRAIIEKVGGYDEELKCVQDLDLNFRILSISNIRISIVEAALTKFNDDNRDDRIMKKVWKTENAIMSERRLMRKIFSNQQVLSNPFTFRNASFFYLRSYVKNAIPKKGIHWAFKEFHYVYGHSLNMSFFFRLSCRLYASYLFLLAVSIATIKRKNK